METEDDWIRIREACGILGLSKQMVGKLVKEAVIPAERYRPRCIRLRRSDVEAYRDAHRTGPTPAKPAASTVRPRPLKALKPRALGSKKSK